MVKSAQLHLSVEGYYTAARVNYYDMLHPDAYLLKNPFSPALGTTEKIVQSKLYRAEVIIFTLYIVDMVYHIAATA